MGDSIVEPDSDQSNFDTIISATTTKEELVKKPILVFDQKQ